MAATATKQLTLYQYEACPFCWKVKAALKYKRLPYKVVEVHPLNKKELSFSEEYKKVPVLLHGDVQVNDSTEILQYLDREFPEKKLFCDEGLWLKWADEQLVHALPPLIYSTLGLAIKAFDYITKVGDFNFFQKRLIKYSGAFVMTMVAKKGAKKRNISNPVENFEGCLREWERAIESEGYLGKEAPNVADLTVYGYLSSIRKLPAFRFVKENKRVYEWMRSMDRALGGCA